jgi:hypothetical protein
LCTVTLTDAELRIEGNSDLTALESQGRNLPMPVMVQTSHECSGSFSILHLLQMRKNIRVADSG